MESGATLIQYKPWKPCPCSTTDNQIKPMKTTNALVAAALAGVFAAGTTITHAAQSMGNPAAAEKEKDDCPGKDKDKDKDKCDAKEKKGTFTNEAEKDKCDSKEKKKDKDTCDGKDGCSGKKKEKKEGTIL